VLIFETAIMMAIDFAVVLIHFLWGVLSVALLFSLEFFYNVINFYAAICYEFYRECI